MSTAALSRGLAAFGRLAPNGIDSSILIPPAPTGFSVRLRVMLLALADRDHCHETMSRAKLAWPRGGGSVRPVAARASHSNFANVLWSAADEKALKVALHAERKAWTA